MSAAQQVEIDSLDGRRYLVECYGDGPLVVARVREGQGHVWTITHRMSGWAITCDDFRSFDADALEHACRVRDELLAIPHDWTAADPRRDASDETMAAVRAVWAREHARRGEP